MRRIADIGAAVIGTGFIGTVHVEALRRIGVQVRGVLGCTPERGEARAAALGVPRAYQSLEALLDDPAVDVVHVTSPNDLHLPQAMADPGRRQARRLREAARDVGRRVARAGRPGRDDRPGQRGELQHPLLPAQPARARPRDRRRGRRRPAGDRPLLPGLAAARDRLELAARAGARRLAARRRRHRLALARPDQLRHRPPDRGGHGRPGDLHRGAARADRAGRDILDRGRGRDRRPATIATEDAATILLRFDNGARGVAERLADQRRPEELAPVRDRRVGRRGRLGLGAARPAVARPSRSAERDPASRTRR